MRHGVSIALIAFASACFDTENDDLEILDSSQQISVVNTNPSAFVGEASDRILPTPVDQAVVTYSSMRGDRAQDTLVFVDDPTRAWEDFWVDGNRDTMPRLTNRGVGVSWYADCPKGGACDARSFALAQLQCADFPTSGPRPERKVEPELRCGEKAGAIVTRGYFSWDRGACSKRSNANDLLQQIVSGAKDAMLANLDEADPWSAATQANVLAEAQTSMWRGDRGEPLGGLAMRLRIDVRQTGTRQVYPAEEIGAPWWVTPVPVPVPYSAETRADVTAGYRWVVKDGVLGVEALRSKVTDEYGDTAVFIGINGPSSHQDGALTRALMTELPQKLSASAYAEQLVEVVSESEQATSCESEIDCTDRTSYARSFVRRRLSLASADTPALLSDAERQNLQSLFEQRSEWVCTKRAKRDTKTCNVLLRAKRVNAYPDGVELVFREGGERPMTREFALEIIARHAVRTKVLETNPMCDAPVHGEKLRMNFVNQVQHATYD